MVTMTIKGEVINAKSRRTPAKSKTAIDLSLTEEKQGKINHYKNSDDLFQKVLNV